MTTFQNSRLIAVSEAGNLHGLKTWTAFNTSSKEGLIIKNIKLVNFDNAQFLVGCNGCDPLNPMKQGKKVPNTYFENLTFDNCNFK